MPTDGNLFFPRQIPLVSPSEVVERQLYKPSVAERDQAEKWQLAAVQRSLAASPPYRKFQRFLRCSQVLWIHFTFACRHPSFRFEDVMSEKTVTVMIGLEMANPASSGGMIQVLKELQPFVPMVDEKTGQLTPLFCDQNFFERG
jgi:allophanate hydrolase subunit 2